MDRDLKSSSLLEGMLSQSGKVGAQAAVTAARYLSTLPLSQENALLFIRLLKKNIPAAADLLLVRSNPASFFSTLTPSRPLILSSFSLLGDFRPCELYTPVVLSLLGVLLTAYVHCDSGFSLYELSVSDLYQVGKQLVCEDEQVRELASELLYRWRGLSSSDEAKKAAEILDCYLDHSKQLEQAIPAVLLVQVP